MKKSLKDRILDVIIERLGIILITAAMTLAVHIWDSFKESKDVKWIGEHIADKQHQIDELKGK